MTPEVEEAIAQIRSAYPNNVIKVTPDQQGGAYVIMEDAPLGPQYQPNQSWIGFTIGFQYPNAHIYPFFTDPGLKRLDGGPLGQAFQQPIDWRGTRTTQISRSSPGWSPAVDTALLKLTKVLEWLSVQ